MIKTALIGYGLAGKVFHAPLIRETKGLDLAYVMSSRSAEIQEDLPGVLSLENFESALASDAGLIVIASPNHTHFDFAKRALENGKHVVVDKPMTATAKQAKELASLAEQKKLVLSVFHNRRLDGDFLTVQKLLEENVLGDIFYCESNFHRFRPNVNMGNWRETTQTAGGVFYDLAPHLVDQALALFGTPDLALAEIGRQREGALNDDSFHLLLIKGRTRIHLNAQTVYKAPAPRFVVNGDKGSFVKYGMDPQEARLKERGWFPGIGADSPENYGKLHFEGGERTVPTENGNYLSYYRNIVDTIGKGGAKPLVSAQDGVRTMEFLEALGRSQREKRFVEKGKDYDLA